MDGTGNFRSVVVYLGRVDIYARCVRNRRDEVPSSKGLGNPTPTKGHASVHALDCLVAMKCQQNLVCIAVLAVQTALWIISVLSITSLTNRYQIRITTGSTIGRRSVFFLKNRRRTTRISSCTVSVSLLLPGLRWFIA